MALAKFLVDVKTTNAGVSTYDGVYLTYNRQDTTVITVTMV